MSRASKGRNFENEVKEIFLNAGFSVVRGAASKGKMLGAKVDLVATKLTEVSKRKVFLTVVGAQCKVKRR